MKAIYQAPVLRAHGKVETLTQQTRVGNRLDAGFTAGTLISDITVS